MQTVDAICCSWESRLWLVMFPLLLSPGCKAPAHTGSPHRYLAITHPALNRLTFFDLDQQRTVGALPTQKLPHDMLLSADGNSLLVVNSGAQCISSYSILSPDLWAEAAAFMQKDSSSRSMNQASSLRMGASHGIKTSDRPGTYLNTDPAQFLPTSIVQNFRTDTTYPAQANEKHAIVHARSHTACFDCHDRSVGGKPFGPMFSADKSEIYLVHLAYRNLTILNAATLSIKRQIPLSLPKNLSPVEVWVHPSKSIAFVTCRNEIGASLPGRILVVDLRSGQMIRQIQGGIYPWHLLPDPTGKRLYVNNFQSSSISVIDIEAGQIVDSLVAQNGPAMMCFIPGRDEMIVSCFYTDNVVILNTRTHATERVIHVDTNPTSVEIVDQDKRLYVLCGGESSLNVVNLESGTVTERHKLLFGAYAFHTIHQ